MNQPMGRPATRSEEPIPLHDRAIQDLSFIRDTMERATTVTSVPGWGGVAMGVSALFAAWFAGGQSDPGEWLAVWLGEAAVALGIGGLAMIRKAESTRTSLRNRASRLFVGAFVPPIVVGALLTVVLYQLDLQRLLPGIWLLLYGTAVTTAGAYSVRAVPIMGVCLMTIGGIALFLPASWGNWAMALGFGILQMVFGFYIARRHGG